MENEKYHTVGTVSKLTTEKVKRGKFDTQNTQIHERSYSCLEKGTSIKSGGIKLVLWVSNTFNTNKYGMGTSLMI